MSTRRVPQLAKFRRSEFRLKGQYVFVVECGKLRTGIFEFAVLQPQINRWLWPTGIAHVCVEIQIASNENGGAVRIQFLDAHRQASRTSAISAVWGFPRNTYQWLYPPLPPESVSKTSSFTPSASRSTYCTGGIQPSSPLLICLPARSVMRNLQEPGFGSYETVSLNAPKSRTAELVVR